MGLFGARQAKPTLCDCGPLSWGPIDVAISPIGLFPGDKCIGTIGRATQPHEVPVWVRKRDDGQQAFVDDARCILADLPSWYGDYPGALAGKRCGCLFTAQERWVVWDLECPPDEDRILHGDPNAPEPQGVLEVTDMEEA